MSRTLPFLLAFLLGSTLPLTACFPSERHEAPATVQATIASSTSPVAASVTASVTASVASPVTSSTPSSVGSGVRPVSSEGALAISSSNAAPGGSAALPPPCPPEMAEVGRSCIDKWEAHLVTMEADGRTLPQSPYERPEKGKRYEARSQAGVVPQAYINRNEAQAACEAAGKRLCSLREWYAACRGPRGFMYPYGPQMKKGACNASKPHLLSRVHGTNPRAWKYKEHFNDPKLNQEPGFLAKTGEHTECVSGYGIADMVGNLHEWISDPVDASLENKIPLRDDIRDKIEKNTGNAIFMGGFYSTTSEHGRGCAFVTIGHERTYHDYSTGFRCCKAADRGPKK